MATLTKRARGAWLSQIGRGSIFQSEGARVLRILVLGGGVVGVTTAYELMRDGHEVTVLEKNDAVGTETSWGNAGMIAPGHSFAWSSPSAPMTLLKSLTLPNQALRFKPSPDFDLWAWSLKFLAQCTKRRSEYNTIRKHKLASYSQGVLHETIAALGLSYDRVDKGILYFYRSQAKLDAGVAHMQILARCGQKIEVLNRAQALALEPALESVANKIAGAVYCPTDETGDCNKFTSALAAHCLAHGVEIQTGVGVRALQASGDEITGVRTTHGLMKADAYVVALGNGSRAVGRTVGDDLPIYPVKGYSLTIPIEGANASPRLGTIDEENLVAISPFGDRMRVTATAEISGYSRSHKPADFAFMAGVARELYPNGGRHEKAEMWAGLRPMTPTNLPIIGRRKKRNLFYNTGHGHIGWTMSHGSARLLAATVSGRQPDIALETVVD